MPGSELVILGLGRLGGGALTYASDLDLIFLFTGDFRPESDGRKPLGATLYYNRLSQRIIGALSVPTATGPFYEVDTRLRPSGTQGPLAVTLDSFALYQRESAWTWEHMALIRARPVFGEAAARRATEAVIDETLNAERDPAKLVADAKSMRREMSAHKKPAGPLDVKLIDGGLVDLEFTVHVLQLRHRIAIEPRLDVAIPALLRAGLLAPEVEAAHALLTRMLVTLRLMAPETGEPAPASRAIVARACRCGSWEALLAAYADARQVVKAEWRRVATGKGD